MCRIFISWSKGHISFHNQHKSIYMLKSTHKVIITSTSICWLSTDIRSPTSKGCVTKRKIKDSNKTFAALPNIKTDGKIIDETNRRTFEVSTPKIKTKAATRITARTWFMEHKKNEFLNFLTSTNCA